MVKYRQYFTAKKPLNQNLENSNSFISIRDENWLVRQEQFSHRAQKHEQQKKK
jgi:hypothetical protein